MGWNYLPQDVPVKGKKHSTGIIMNCFMHFILQCLCFWTIKWSYKLLSTLKYPCSSSKKKICFRKGNICRVNCQFQVRKKEQGSPFSSDWRNRVLFLVQIIPCNFKTGGANVALEKKSCGAKGRIFGSNGFLPYGWPIAYGNYKTDQTEKLNFDQWTHVRLYL